MKLGNYVLATLAKSGIRLEDLHKSIMNTYYEGDAWVSLSEFKDAITDNTLMATDFMYICSLLKLDVMRLLHYSDEMAKGVVLDAKVKKVLDTKDILTKLREHSVYKDRGIEYELSNVIRGTKDTLFEAYYESDNCNIVALEIIERVGEELRIKGVYYNSSFGDFLKAKGGTLEAFRKMDRFRRQSFIKEEGELIYQLFPERKIENVKTIYI